MKAWVTEELKYLDLGDKRLNKRLEKMVSELSQYCSVKPKASMERARERGRRWLVFACL